MLVLNYVEIDVPFCSLTYGVAPCSASLVSSPPTGTDKCFNSIKTCQDRANFSEQTVTLRYAMPVDHLPRTTEAIPSIKSIDLSPATISLGEDLGQRATLRVELADHRHSDTGDGYDKYWTERDYNPYLQGTYWGKFRARQPYLRGRALRLIRGQVGDHFLAMERRHFFIESIEGPTQDGVFTIIAKDALKLADGDRAQAPRVSNGFLVAGISAVATSATLSPSGIGNAEYPVSGWVAIGGKEICVFSRSGDVLTLTRAQYNTIAQEHAAQDRMQLCLRFSGADPANIIATLLEEYAEVDGDLIPLSIWTSETATFLGRVYSALIPEPTAVGKLIAELCEQAALAVWWDDLARVIRLQVLRGIDTTARRFDEGNVPRGSIKTREQPDKRVSQVLTYFGQINPLKRLDDLDNYRSTAVTVDATAEADYGGAAIKKVHSRWIPALGRTVADRLNAIILGRFRDPPRRFEFETFLNSDAPPELGRGYRFAAWPIQGATGAASEAAIQVTRLGIKPYSYAVEAEEMLYQAPEEDLTIRTLVVDSNINNINLRTSHDALYPPPQAGDDVLCIINSGVIVGSNSRNLPAFHAGSWPTGVTVTLRILGRIQGHGGDGGTAQEFFTVPAQGGSPGGVALFTREQINLEVLIGRIWGGGGGGGGGGGTFNPPFAYPGGGGGGGSGKEPGAGGSGDFPGEPGGMEVGGFGGVQSVGSGFGGKGGDPGQAGSPGEAGVVLGGGPTTPGDGGGAGSAIDGASFVTVLTGPGDVRGPQVN